MPIPLNKQILRTRLEIQIDVPELQFLQHFLQQAGPLTDESAKQRSVSDAAAVLLVAAATASDDVK